MKYIAYGSNMIEEQMAHRCPGAKLIGTGYLPNHRLEFYLHATVERTRAHRAKVPVAVWEISEADERSLDRYEGFPTYYTKHRRRVVMDDGSEIWGIQRICQNAAKPEGNVQIVIGNMLPNGVGRSKAAVRHNSVDIFRQIQPCRHQNRGCTHGYAAKVNGEFRATSLTGPVNPVQAVIAFDWAKANEITAAISLAPLFCIQDAASIYLPEIGYHPKVFVPRRAPAVHGNDDSLRILTGNPVPYQRHPIMTGDLHRFIFFLRQLFSRFSQFLLKRIAGLGAGNQIARFLKYPGFVPIQSLSGQKPCCQIGGGRCYCRCSNGNSR